MLKVDNDRIVQIDTKVNALKDLKREFKLFNTELNNLKKLEDGVF